MKPLTLPILLAASLSLAMPLKPGNTWTWSVGNIGASANGWVTATVLGSARHDSGTAWTISVRDSATRATDTAVALERSDKSQAWLKGSARLLMELQPWNGKAVNLAAPKAIVAPWGFQSLRANGWLSMYGYYGIAPGPGGRSNGTMTEGGEGGTNYPIPRGVWIDTVGPMIYRSYMQKHTELRLVSFNHRTIDPSPYTAMAQLPETGTTLEWEESIRLGCWSYCPDSGRVVHHTWKILEKNDPASGLVSLKVRDSSIDDSGHVTDSIRNIAQNLRSWSSDVPLARCPQPSDAWFWDASDSVAPTGIVRNTTTGTASVGAGIRYDLLLVSEKIRPDHQMDSFTCTKQTYQSRTWLDITTRILVSVDGVQVRAPKITAGVLSPSRPSERSLANLSSRHPGLSLRWTDVRGRSGTLLARDAASLNKFCPRGPLFLTATLPDGTAWKASTFVH